jgi:hypothetical protein
MFIGNFISIAIILLFPVESSSDIICIQEHWLYEFQKESLALALPNMDMCVICSDTFARHSIYSRYESPELFVDI